MCLVDKFDNRVVEMCLVDRASVEIIKGGFWCSLPLFDHFCGAPTPSM